jgi:RNA polymerase sigma factor (sigma-70 family)
MILSMTAPDGEVVYRQHGDELIRYATVLVGPADAPDVVVNAVLGAIHSRHWRTVREPRAYLFRCVLNEARSQRRSRARAEARERRAAVASSVPPAESSADAERVLQTLSPRQRAVVYLAYWEDRNTETIAATLGISEGAVKRHLARARENLRSQLSND